jgi:hypothetical protein
MNFTQQLLSDLFKKATNFQPVKIGKVNQGSTIAVNLGYGSVRAQALQNLSEGDAIAFQTDQGNWYLIGNEQAAQNTTQTQQVIYRVVKPKNEAVSPIITLIGVEGLGNSGLLPGTGNHTEFWLTGGRYRKKRIDNLNDTSNRYDSRYSTNTGFITNLGNGKYYVATNLYNPNTDFDNPNTDFDYTGGGFSYDLILKFQKNNILTTIPIDSSSINQDLYYQGNGIWQSVPENGMTDIIAALGLDSPTELGINTLPRDKNCVVYNNELHQYTGTVAFETFEPESEFLFLIIGFANKSVEYETYLPNGNSLFTYNAVRSGGLPQYTYTESISGDLLLIAWARQYITHTFTAEKISNLTQLFPSSEDPFLVRICKLTKTVSKTETVTLETFGDTAGSKGIVLDTASKFYVIGMLPSEPLTLESTTFTINHEDIGIEYYEDIEGMVFDPFNFIGESMITSYAIDNKKPYLIKCVLEEVNLVPVSTISGIKNRMRLVFNITSKKALPKIKYKGTESFFVGNDGNWGLPINAIILDNGGFWNYWLLSQVNNLAPFGKEDMAVANVIYKDVHYGDEFGVGVEWFIYKTPDQFNTTYPMSGFESQVFGECFVSGHPLPGFLFNKKIAPAHPILLTDNLVNNKIYSVRNTYTFQDYYQLLNGDLLSDQIRFSQLPIAQWDISQDGKIKYKNTFLVDYEMTVPYFEGDPKALVSGITVPQSYSYYPA